MSQQYMYTLLAVTYFKSHKIWRTIDICTRTWLSLQCWSRLPWKPSRTWSFPSSASPSLRPEARSSGSSRCLPSWSRCLPGLEWFPGLLLLVAFWNIRNQTHVFNCYRKLCVELRSLNHLRMKITATIPATATIAKTTTTIPPIAPPPSSSAVKHEFFG